MEDKGRRLSMPVVRISRDDTEDNKAIFEDSVNEACIELMKVSNLRF